MSQYVIIRDTDYLEHFGIKGQKWGVRRFENLDGTLTPAGKKRYYVVKGVGEDRYNGNEKLALKYSKDVRKLEKAYNNADLSKQIKDYSKYKKRARTASRIGGAALGLAIPASIGEFITNDHNGLHSTINAIAKRAKENHQSIDATLKHLYMLGNPRTKNSRTLLEGISKGYKDISNSADNVHSFFNKIEEAFGGPSGPGGPFNPVYRFTRDAAILAAGSAYGVAAYNKIRSSIAKRKLSEKGHEKAVQKAKALTDKLMNTYSGTRYSDILSKRVEAYKNEHPNTQMSDREILKALMPLT